MKNVGLLSVFGPSKCKNNWDPYTFLLLEFYWVFGWIIFWIKVHFSCTFTVPNRRSYGKWEDTNIDTFVVTPWVLHASVERGSPVQEVCGESCRKSRRVVSWRRKRTRRRTGGPRAREDFSGTPTGQVDKCVLENGLTHGPKNFDYAKSSLRPPTGPLV